MTKDSKPRIVLEVDDKLRHKFKMWCWSKGSNMKDVLIKYIKEKVYKTEK